MTDKIEKFNFIHTGTSHRHERVKTNQAAETYKPSKAKEGWVGVCGFKKNKDSLHEDGKSKRLVNHANNGEVLRLKKKK